ncbi:hypothetical protein [Methanosarcina mazei]|jgi:hypothetical protein|uniref:hypothetical protein n=1 Tax=Methanosarcina mazei TaxID=2209 RepID=UPI000B1FED3B|nr:hypothetical protein [Methanosarcina mazei]
MEISFRQFTCERIAHNREEHIRKRENISEKERIFQKREKASGINHNLTALERY